MQKGNQFVLTTEQLSLEFLRFHWGEMVISVFLRGKKITFCLHEYFYSWFRNRSPSKSDWINEGFGL